jgi:DNA-binding IclR family transcriptional regulator
MVTRRREEENTIKSLVKALNILKLFSPGKNEWTVRDMVEALGYHKSSVQRLVTTLEAHGFLERSQPPRSRFVLGPIVLMLGNVASQSIDLRAVARPYLQRLVEETGETAHLCVVDQSQCYYLDKIDSPQAVRIATYVGQRLHLHCSAVGKALLSGMTEEEVDHVIDDCGLPRFTETTITDRQALFDELECIRREGLAQDNAEYEASLRCVAAPVRDSFGLVVAAISVAAPVQRFTADQLIRFGRSVKETAEQVSARLGYVTDHHEGRDQDTGPADSD